MPAQKKYDSETQEREVRMYADRLAERDVSQRASRREVGELLGIKPETLRNWIRRDLGEGRRHRRRSRWKSGTPGCVKRMRSCGGRMRSYLPHRSEQSFERPCGVQADPSSGIGDASYCLGAGNRSSSRQTPAEFLHVAFFGRGPPAGFRCGSGFLAR